MADISDNTPNRPSSAEDALETGLPGSDANDYSRFDNIDESDSDSDSSDATPAMPMVERLARANSAKDSGNESFKLQDWEAAKNSYQEGIKLLESHKDSKPPAVTDGQREEIRRVLAMLYSNKAMVLIKREEWGSAAKASSESLKIDSSNTKALFRRGLAYSKIGMLEESKTDLLQLLQADPENNPAKKELASVRKRLEDHKRQQRQSFAGLFDRGSGMYEDREQEREKRERKLAEQKQQEEDDWRKDNIRRRDLSQPERTFEEYKKQKQAEAKETEKKAKSRSPAPAPAPAKRASSSSSSSTKKRAATAAGDDDEYDEEEQKIINETKQKGYCYFRRNQSEEEKQLLGDVAPKKVDDESAAAAAAAAPAPTPVESDEQQAKRTGGSAWNFAGTFEERDVSSWATNRLQELCLEASISEGGLDLQNDPEAFTKVMSDLDLSSDPSAGMEQLSKLSTKLARVNARVSKAKKVEGDAHIAVVRGTKRYLFDFTMKLEFEIEVDEKIPGAPGASASTDDKIKKFKGTFNLEEISNLSAENEWACSITWKSSPSPLYRERVQQATEKLKLAIFQKIEAFASEYETM